MILIDDKPMEVVAQELKEKYEKSGSKEAVTILCLIKFWEEGIKFDNNDKRRNT